MDHKLTGWLIAGALVSVALASILTPRLLEDDRPSTPVSEPRDSATVPPFGEHVEAPTKSPEHPAATSTDSSVDPHRSSKLLSTVYQSNQSSIIGNNFSNESSLSESEPSVETNESDPNAVVGRPFPISNSVEAGCERPSRGATDGCPEVHHALSVFAQEPRDLAWAPQMEARLRELVMAESGKFTIRGIECRTSLCVAEVASIYGMFHFISGIGGNELLDRSLSTDVGDFGYETDPSMARITVTLMIFKRR